MTFIRTIALAAAACATLSAAAVFQTNFESGVAPAQFTGGGTVQGTENYPTVTPVGNYFLRMDSTNAAVLTLSGLPSHTSLGLSFLLAIIDSWDGSGASYGPDYFRVSVDGTTVFDNYFNNFGSSDNSYTGSPLTFGTNLGFNSGFPDSAYNVALTVPHTGSTATIRFFNAGGGFQGGFDESSAIDNVDVAVSGGASTPEPASALLLASGLVAAVLARRRVAR